MSQGIVLVGDGLMGCSLALCLFEAGLPFDWLGANEQINASKVAAGLYHPVVFKKPGYSWNAKAFMKIADESFLRWQTLTRSTFLFQAPLVRIFATVHEKKLWEQFESEHPGTMQINGLPSDSRIIAPHGTGSVLEASRLDVHSFVQTTIRFFMQKGIYRQSFVQAHEVEPFADGSAVVVQGKKYDKALFAEGWKPEVIKKTSEMLKPVKGEVLTIRINDFPDVMLHSGVYIVPYGNQTFKVGSTFNWHQLDNVPSSEGLDFLTEKVRAILLCEFEVLKHEASVRPASRDRRPLVGSLPDFPQVMVCNGLGSRGALLAPSLAYDVVQHIQHHTPLSNEINWLRQWKS